MRLRQVCAMAAVFALASTTCAVLTAPSEAAATDSLAVAAPRVLGVGAAPVEFAAVVNNNSFEHTAARLFVQLRVTSADLKLEWVRLQSREKDGGMWRNVALAAQGRLLTGATGDAGGFPLARPERRTIRFRLSIEPPAQQPTAGTPTTATTAGRDRPAAPTLREARRIAGEAAGGGHTGAGCASARAGLTLRTELHDVNQSGSAVGTAIAADTDTVGVGLPGVRFEGFPAGLTAGRAPSAFTLTICNRTDSDYRSLLPTVGLRWVPANRTATPAVRPGDVVMEAFDADRKTWVPVSLDALPGTANVVLADLADRNGIGVRHGKEAAGRLRLGLRRGAPAGEVAAFAFVSVLPSYLAGDAAATPSRLRGSAGAAPGATSTSSPDGNRSGPGLPDTGGHTTAVLLSTGLLVAGVGGVLAVRRRSQHR